MVPVETENVVCLITTTRVKTTHSSRNGKVADKGDSY